MLIYKLQRVARRKSHSPALTCSMCQFGMENCIKMNVFCHFYNLNYQKNLNKPVTLAKGASAAIPRPTKHNFEILVQYFSKGV